MKKGDVIKAKVDAFKFPNLGLVHIEDKTVEVAGALPEQEIEFMVTKKRKNKIQGKLLSIDQKRDDYRNPVCCVEERCGGCIFQTLPYSEECELKESYVLNLLQNSVGDDLGYQGFISSPLEAHYRNKMEYSFGDDTPGGELHLGLHERGKFYNVLNADDCILTDSGFDIIRRQVLNWAIENKLTTYHKRSRSGLLRHLVVRKGEKSKEYLVNLVTTSSQEFDKDSFIQMLLALPIDGTITGTIHTINDKEADAVIPESTSLLYGSPVIQDELLGLSFEIKPFSFFQVNTLGAEKLYSIVRKFAGDQHRELILDLYCGTGTIAQLLSSSADQVIGVEIVEEAVEAATINAARNNIENCTFIAGDVLKEVDSLDKKADLIVLDPPRDGIHPKALPKILSFEPESFIYVACKPESLARDLPSFIASGYQIKKTAIVDMFPKTGHVETVVLMSRKEK